MQSSGNVFAQAGDATEAMIRPVIADSWYRCAEAGLDPMDRPPLLRPHPHVLAQSRALLPVGGLPAKKLRRVFEFVEANIDQPINLDKLASVAAVSRFHFHRQFKKATGSTPHRYIMQRRIERAKTLLSESAVPLIEIAARLGFTDQSHFINTFRKMTAVTPKAYRDGASA
jgi:AraC-like DNA-binding protein